MYLKKLHISNFRCFRDYTIEFAPGVTVLFGKNGSGKTTLIHAIHKALSFAFKRNKDEETINLGAGFPNLKPQNFNKSEDIVRNPQTGLPFPFINIQATAQFHKATLDWEMYASTSTFKVQESKFADAFKALSAEIRSTGTLPLFAYFSDSFPHVSEKKTKLSETEMSLRNLGYLGWNEETAYSNLWITRLTKIWTGWDRANRNVQHEESALRICDFFKSQGHMTEQEYNENIDLHTARLKAAQREKARYDAEVNAIRNCLVKFSQGDSNYEVTDIFVSIYEECGLCLDTRDGRNPAFYHLPAGYQRLFYIVLDIAYRSFILSEGRSTDIPGIVIIDEIDLHLHPELEQVVLQRFMKTFPNVQFIVSTHSPLVLTGIETKEGKNRVLKMSTNSDSPEEWHDVHGIDYNQMLEENMDVSKRKPEIEVLFKKAWNEVAAKNIEAAKQTVEKLENVTPADQTELVKLRAVISRLEIIGR